MSVGNKRNIAALISTFIVGGGQIFIGRLWAGIGFALTFYGSIAIIKIVWTGFNPGFYPLLVVWIIIWLYNILDAYKGYIYEQPPCERNCPAGIPPWVYINYIARGETQPLPFVPFFRTLGLICPAPCENYCTRKAYDDPVAIKHLKLGVKGEWICEVKGNKKGRVAVVGAGPCGLTLAYVLTNQGYQVTIFEKEDRPGGMLALTIPEFRLPPSILNEELKEVLDCGAELRCGVEIGKDIKINQLLSDFNSVFVATGAIRPLHLDIPGVEHANYGLDLLCEIKKGKRFKFGKVGVIGGGNTAIDIARSLRRFGNEVKIYYRRRIKDMPAEHEDRLEAVEEGIEIVPLTLPIEIAGGKVGFIKTELIDGYPTIIDGSEFEVDVDQLVFAIGQEPETEFLNGIIDLDSRCRIITKKGHSSHPRIFAGGDVVTGPKTVANAVGQGVSVAEEIDLALRRIPRFLAWVLKKPYLSDVKLIPFSSVKRLVVEHRNPKERIKDFEAIEIPASEEILKKEGGRCLSCPLRYRP